ncbi:1-acylglycerol-3-phosphate O-acyltransferase [Clostridium bovifaecis]|jgi:1-acyl-sn-glycerol-3-phosphate acyltransferase|uniref:1-acyl-sn-glycerol-3-phosphate acyltransferase n=1 Tax=Clostridium bovifaecis TaxID=2184719 RepID=A0A6I6F5F0_9CLOT|nr:1-acylglycerol-3-phosphate O-acyltransferase [Clostridium bovifaecis]
MRSIGIYTYIVFNLIRTLSLDRKYHNLKKQGKEEEAEKFLHETVFYWAKQVLKKAGVKVEAKGLENVPKEACCFVSNHQGNFDILAILASIDKPMGFIAKKEMEKTPMISRWMRNIRCVFIDRDNVRESLKAINQGAENLKNGYSMVIFPEGTRSKGHNIGEFKKGSLKMATKAKAPIVPITIDGSYKIFEEHNGWLRKGEIKVTVGKPIYLDKLTSEEQKDLAERVKREIVKNL